MAGNVWEWTQSLWERSSEENPDYRYPYGPTDGRENLAAGEEVDHVLRGGAFYNLHTFVQCACRVGYLPNARYWDFGFRVVVLPAS